MDRAAKIRTAGIQRLDSSFVDMIEAYANDQSDIFVFPGFCDVHVHFREPGFSYKETIRSGSLAAAHGGYTTALTMPNLNPAPDCLENLAEQERHIREDACIEVIPYGTITKGRKGEALSDMDALAPRVAAFSDDGSGVQSEEMMLEAMRRAKALGRIIAAHCEDNALLHGGCIHDGGYARAHGLPGICSESEWRQIERDLNIAAKTGCAYHVCHISCKESVELIRQAKKSGVDVSCETGPHYLVLDDGMLEDDGRFKMNPPLRGSSDREALLEGMLDGTVDIIATDHAPHSREEKSKGLKGSAFGIVGLETAFPLLYTKLVRTGVLPLQKLVDLLTENPRRRFGLAQRADDICAWDMNATYEVTEESLLSKGKSTPFLGEKLFGKCLLTLHKGTTAYAAKL